jgi:hypothetical protein
MLWGCRNAIRKRGCRALLVATRRRRPTGEILRKLRMTVGWCDFRRPAGEILRGLRMTVGRGRDRRPAGEILRKLRMTVEWGPARH